MLKERFVVTVLVFVISLVLTAGGLARNIYAEEYTLPYALELDGDGDYVDLPIRPGDLDDGPVTFSCRLKIAPGAGGDRMKIFSGYGDRTGANRWDFEYNNTGARQLEFNEWGGSGGNAGGPALEEDTWYFVSFVWKPGEEVILYIDGEKEASFDIENSSLDDGHNFRLAGRPDGTEKEWEGTIKDVWLWQTARTEEELKSDMQRTPAGDEENLVGYWPLDEDTGETARDKSDNENHGTIVGAEWTITIIPSEILARPHDEVLPAVLEAAHQGPSVSARAQAVELLGKLDAAADEIAPTLLGILEDAEETSDVRLAAAAVISELDADIVDRELPAIMMAWGNNNFGQADIPASLTDPVSVAVGNFHSLALKGDGTVSAWGWNLQGQTTVPSDLSNVTAVDAGGAHNLALKENGTVVAWGLDNYGQSTVPDALEGVKAIAAGGSHSLALKEDGNVVAWGSNAHGQATVPDELSDVIAIAAGSAHSLALKEDGTVEAWGKGTDEVPAGLSKVKVESIAPGGHSLALVTAASRDAGR